MTKREKIKVFLAATQNSTVIERGFKTILEQIPDDLLPGMPELKQKYIAKFDEISANALEDQVTLYDTVMSEAAIDKAIDFYGSKEGQEVIAAGPKINQGLMELAGKATGALTKELFQDLMKLELSEEEMESIGFVRVDMDELEEMIESLNPEAVTMVDPDGITTYDPKNKPKPQKPIKTDDDEVSESDFDKLKDWLGN